MLRGQEQGRENVGHIDTALAHQAIVAQKDAAAHRETRGRKPICSCVTKFNYLLSIKVKF